MLSLRQDIHHSKQLQSAYEIENMPQTQKDFFSIDQ